MADEESAPVNNPVVPAAEKKKKKKKKAAASGDANPSDQPQQSNETTNNATESKAENASESTTGANAKKKKKKPGDKKDEKPKVKKNKMVAALQEALAKAKEVEAQRLREEEEQIKRELELEHKKEEEERRKKELKEKKKLKEKARIEKKKKEGTYMTAKQRADLQRAQQSIQLLRQQGLIKVGSEEKDDNRSVENGENKNDKESELNDLVKVNDKLTHEEEDNEQEEESDEEEESEEEIVDNWEDLEIKDKKKKPTILENISNKEENIKNQVNNVQSQKQPEINNQTTSNTINIKHNKYIKSNALQQQQEVDTLLRSPIVCVLGHVDTGKTKLLDYIRKTHIQDNEAGGITQQIGATFVPPVAIKEQCKISKQPTELEVPGLLIIDTPGHESFTNLRSRGSSLCDIAILVIDIMHGLEPQTIESINLLKSRKTPFIVALNKIDRLYDWKPNVRRDIQDLINSQQPNTKLEFEKRTKEVVIQLNEQSLNAALYYENPNVREYVSLVPTSAVCGDGMGNLINIITHYSQTMLHKKLIFQPNKLEATVLEVKALPGLGTTIDVILVNGRLREGDKIVLAGHDGPIVTQIRSLLVPQPLKELRVKSPYQELKTIKGSIGVKICGHDLDKAVAGLELYVAKNEAEVENFKAECWNRFGSAMKAIKCVEKGVYVQASTLGSLEALLEFLKQSKIPVCGVRIGPVVKRDVMKASIMLENSPDHAVILAFDVKVERDAQEMADHIGLRIFTADIIYHLFDKFTAYKNDLREKKKAQYKNIAVFPCKLKILPNCIFNARNPIVIGVSVEDGIVVPGTPIAVPSKEFVEIGKVSSIEYNHKVVESARKGQEVCLKIEHHGSEAPRLYGRHFDHTDMLMSKITRESIDACKEYFRDDLTKEDWKLMIELKNTFQII